MTTRRIEALLAEYGESHRDATNKAIHWICVPVIVWSLVALLYALPAPEWLPLGWLGPVLALALLYYLVLSVPLALGFAVFAAGAAGLVVAVEAVTPVWRVALVAIVLAWAGQFWGHRIEGRKPSFLKDIQYLLIGPAWLMSFVYRRVGLPV